jgi:hypothetical protein
MPKPPAYLGKQTQQHVHIYSQHTCTHAFTHVHMHSLRACTHTFTTCMYTCIRKVNDDVTSVYDDVTSVYDDVTYVYTCIRKRL